MPTYAGTKTTPTCNQVIQACDKALADKDAAIKSRDKELSQYQIMSKAQADEIAAKDRELSAWWRNPYVWGVVGLGLGIYLGKK